MVLRVTNKKEDFDIGTTVISLQAFGMKEYHPLLASKVWEKVYIDLTDETPRGIIKQLVKRTKVVPVFDKTDVTPRVLQLLCEILPDYIGQLRSLYAKSPEEFKNLINKIEQERWV